MRLETLLAALRDRQRVRRADGASQDSWEMPPALQTAVAATEMPAAKESPLPRTPIGDAR
eukprot:14474486-Alexandrium_andersonii.AAC.1